jgi:uncharacterized protein DUF5320
MPGGDGTGPSGMGPMTGRAAGYCAGQNAPGFASAIGGRGFFGGGGGRGGGWGRRNRFYATGMTGWQRAAAGWPQSGGPVSPYAAQPAPFAPAMNQQQELDMLKGQTEYFEDALAGMKKRIEELEAQTKT